MYEPKTPLELSKLATRISQLPDDYRKQLEPLMDDVVDYVARRKSVLRQIQEALTQLRVDVKYLMFDLEATRRERDAALGDHRD